VNGLTEGMWLLTATDPYRTAVVVLVHVFGPVQLTLWLKSPLTSLTPPTGCHGAGPTWLSSVCAHAFSRLSTTLAVMAADVGGNYVW